MQTAGIALEGSVGGFLLNRPLKVIETKEFIDYNSNNPYYFDSIREYAQGSRCTGLDDELKEDSAWVCAPREQDPVSDPAALQERTALADARARIAELESQLQRSNQMLQGLVQSNPLAVQIFDTDGRLLESNPASARIFGADFPPAVCLFEADFPGSAEMKEALARARQGLQSEIPDLVWKAGPADPPGLQAVRHLHTFIYPVINSGGQVEAIMLMYEDISERMIAEEKFRLAFHAAPIPMTLAEARMGAYLEINEEAVKYIGYSRQEVVGRKWSEMGLLSPEDQRRLVETMYRDGRLKDYETRIILKDGSVKDVVFNADYVEIGGIMCQLTTVMDITERKAMERALQESEERYRALFWHTPVGVVNYNTDLIVTESNERFLDIMDTDRERLIGLDLKRLRDPGIFPAMEAAVKGKEGHFEGFYRVTSSNVCKWLVIHTAPLYLSDGSLAGGVAITEDVSSRREAEMERDRLRHLLENTFDSMPGILVGIDQHRRITQWNREASQRTGLSPAEARGRLIEEALPLTAPLIANINAALEEQRLMSEERLNYYDNDEALFARVVIYPLTGGEERGAVVLLEDVTEMVRLEEMMIQSEKMISVGGMAAGMAHEINNPLGGIMQGSQNILRRLEPGSSLNQTAAVKCGTTMEAIHSYAEARGIITFLEGIRSSGARASAIVSNMLQFSRASGARTEYADLSALVEQTIELASSDYDLQKSYDFRHINILRDYDDELPPVLCSPVEIEQVVLNLLKNAAQAMAGQQKRQYISVQTRQEGQWAVLEVADNGPGMNEKTRRRVFEPFFTTKPTGLGTGLGLAVSYFIITSNHRGQIFLESQPGKGTAFTIRLPLDRESSSAPA